MMLSALMKRHSVRAYTAQAVTPAMVHELLLAGQIAPTGMNNRAIEYVVIRDQALKQQLYELLEPQQEFVAQAPVLILPCTDLEKIHLPAPERTIVATADLAIATAQIMAQASELGLGTVWKHIPQALGAKVAALLGLPASKWLCNLLPIGFPAHPVKPHGEEEYQERRVHAERW